MPDWQEAFRMPESGAETFVRGCGTLGKLRRRHKKTARRRLFLQGKVAKRTGLEPATSSVTGWRSNRTELPLHNLDCRPLPCGEDVRFIYARKDSDKKKVYFCNRKRTPVFIIKDTIVLTLYLFQNDNNFPALFILV